MPLFADLEPFNVLRLPVDGTHTLHVEQCGNPEGRPVVVLHGGPGGGCSPTLRRYFDPAHWHIILFDQRGAGQSTPSACIESNTLKHLVADMETLRQRLGVRRWTLFGGSWGATLALRYAQACTEQVEALVLRGSFLGRREDLQWLYGGGAGRLQPEAWARFLSPLTEVERCEPLRAYHRRLHGGDSREREQLAAQWAQWEAACSTLRPSPTVQAGFARQSVPLAMIETHYFVNDCFLADAPILKGMSRIREIPAIIVHGRYDLVCPAEQAWLLHAQWPASELRMVESAGHSASELPVQEALLKAVADLQARGVRP